MKQDDITYKKKLGDLRLEIVHPNNKRMNFVLVEGKSDIKLFHKLFDQNRCKVKSIPGGNIKLEACVSMLVKKHSLIIGIRDADFIHLSDEVYQKKNMFLTDCHDIEMTMLSQEDILNRLLFEYRTDYPKEKHFELRNKLIKSIEMVSYLKWLNDQENIKLNFKKTGFQDLVSFENFTMDFPQYLQRVFSKSKNAKINPEIINQKIITLMKSQPDVMQLTNGHDLFQIFAKFLRGEKEKFSDENLASAVRMAFDIKHFQATKLYHALDNWSKQNKTELFEAKI